MKNCIYTLFLILLVSFPAAAEPVLVVDHTAVDAFDQIPVEWITQVKNLMIQYVGQSHSRQLPHGLELLEAENPLYGVQVGTNPNEMTDVGVLKVERSYYAYGNWQVWLVDDNGYWSTEDARQRTIDTAYQAIQEEHPFYISLWCWCWDIVNPSFYSQGGDDPSEFTDTDLQTYLDAIHSFNGDPTINTTKFVYHTSITDEANIGESGWRVTRMNDLIRQGASDNNGILFDQADIENWSNDNSEQRTDTWGEHTLRLRHTDYDEDVGVAFPEGHSNEALCIRKAKAMWWMLARLAGWDGTPAGGASLHLTSPNGGQSLAAGSIQPVTWTSSEVDQVDISYSDDDGDTWQSIVNEYNAASGSYDWTVPDIISTDCLVKISDTAGAASDDQSDAVFTIHSNGDWGDVDDNESVDVADALVLATYSINPGLPALTQFASYIQERGDVDNSLAIDVTDALMCATYELFPDNVYPGGRIGAQIGTVPKPTADSYAIVPHLDVNVDSAEAITLTPLITAEDASVLIGAVSVSIRWNSAKYGFVSCDSNADYSVVNAEEADLGVCHIARFKVDGLQPFDLPSIQLHVLQATGDDQYDITVHTASEAMTFIHLEAQNTVITSVEEDPIPTAYILYPNSPNPFNAGTTIRYYLADLTDVHLDIFNISGQRVRTLVNTSIGSGTHEVMWDGADDAGSAVGSGVYFYRLATPSMMLRQKMLFMK